MSENNSWADPKIRLTVATWPEDASRGAVSAFCRKHGVSRSWFYKLRSRARRQGPWPVLDPISRRPATTPGATDPQIAEIALQVRAELKAEGWDYGPISVKAKMGRRGLNPPSRATLARIFARAGQVVPEPRKRPRSSYTRFVYPAPNCCWQLDATEVAIGGGRTAVVLQLIDDHSRLALATLAAHAETSAAAMQVTKTAIARHGVPQRFLSDNSAAINPTRLGRSSPLVRYLTSLGALPITGKTYKPTTQGKNERLHQTLARRLATRTLPATLAELQTHLDDFDDYYNNERPHQGLGEDTTPHEAWKATPKAPAPQPPPTSTTTPPQQATRSVSASGEVVLTYTRYQIGKTYAGEHVHLLYHDHTVEIFDSAGTHITTYPRPPRTTSYVGNQNPTNKPRPRAKPSTKS